MATTDYGTEFRCLNDIDYGLSVETDEDKVIAYSIFRCLSTDKGALAAIGDDPEYGYGLLRLVNSEFDNLDVSGEAGRIKQAAEYDPRVASADVKVSYNRSTETLTVEMQVTKQDGSVFDLVIGIDQLGPELLSVGGDPIAAAGITTYVTAVEGARGPAGPPGEDGTGGGSAAARIDVQFTGEFYDDTASEVLVFESLEDFDVLTLSATLDVSFLGITKSSGAATGTFKVRVGGTSGAVDGTVVATVTRTNTSYGNTQNVATYVNPGGLRYVKLTVNTSAALSAAYIKGASVVFTE
jgi:hypothetical protein